MKKNKIIYWTITGILIAGLLTSTIPSILMMDYAVDHFTNYLGYPKYFLLFTGITKMLGIIGLFVPKYPRMKEWIYAGLTFDLVGAIYSAASVNEPFMSYLFIVVALLFLIISYVYYHKIQRSLLIADN